MPTTEYMLRCLHRLHRADPWIKTMYNSVVVDMNGISGLLDDDYNNIFFRWCTAAGAAVFERDLGYDSSGLDLVIRRKLIETNWKSRKFSSIPIMQDIADSFYGGKMNVDFIGGKIVYRMINYLSNLNDFVASVDRIKPAHLGYRFVYHSETNVKFYTGVAIKAKRKTVITIASDLSSINNQSIKMVAMGAVRSYRKTIIRSGD